MQTQQFQNHHEVKSHLNKLLKKEKSIRVNLSTDPVELLQQHDQLEAITGERRRITTLLKEQREQAAREKAERAELKKVERNKALQQMTELMAELNQRAAELKSIGALCAEIKGLAAKADIANNFIAQVDPGEASRMNLYPLSISACNRRVRMLVIQAFGVDAIVNIRPAERLDARDFDFADDLQRVVELITRGNTHHV